MRSSSFHFKTFILGLVMIAASAGIYYSFGSQKPLLLSAVDYRIMDVMFHLRGPRPDTGDVVIVDIDEKSLGILGQWPWPRNNLAVLTRKLIENQVRAIGFDIVFAEKDRTSPLYYFNNLPQVIKGTLPKTFLTKLTDSGNADYDADFADALSSGPTVLGYSFKMIDDGLKSDEAVPFPSIALSVQPSDVTFKNLPLISAYRAIVNHPDVAAAETEGFFNVFTDPSGTTRQVPLFMRMDGIPYPSLAFEVYRIGIHSESATLFASKKIKLPRPPILGVQLKKQFIPTDSRGQLFINHRGPAGTFKYISAVDIINGREIKDVKNKFILIGSSAKGLYDLRATPFSGAIPGVEINATIIDNLIQSDPFVYDRLTEIGLTYAITILGGLILSFALSFFGPLVGSIFAFMLICTTILFNYYYFFLNNHYLGLMYPLITSVAILLFLTIFNAFTERKSKQYIKKAFSHYVAGDVVQELIQNPKALTLTGEEKTLTVLFSDIRNFTSISEQMPSRELGLFLNDYFSQMSRIIITHGGTVDKFIGDAVMAFWGAPKNDPDHAFKAVQAAMQMKAMTETLTQEFSQKNLPSLRIGIGINTGEMTVGNFGSNERFDYTVMGDNVNLASRLEGANKNYGTTILISKTTRALISERIFCRYIDRVQVKGKAQAVDLFEPLMLGEPQSDLLKEVQIFEQGIRAYQEQDFVQAQKIMQDLFSQTRFQLYQSYLDRIHKFLAHPPPPEWTGVERRSRLPVNKLLDK